MTCSLARHVLTSALIALVLAVVLPAPPVAAQEAEIQTADYDVSALTYPDLPDFDVPEPERVELDNGMTVFLLEDHELPTIDATARISGGSVYEPHEKRGLAAVTGQVMRSGGTASMSPDSLNTVLENLGATVETSIGETSGSAYMSTLAENVDTVLPIFADVLRQPAFAEEKLQQAKSRQKSAISRRNDNARQIASREFDKILYGEDSPYARTAEYYTIDRIERQDLTEFHDRFVQPSNVLLSVWGDFEAQEMEQKIREQFGDWSAPEDAESPTPPTPDAERESSVNFVQKGDVNQSTIYMGHPGEITRRGDDYAAVTLMNEVLSGGFSGRLFQQVRKEKGLAYRVFGNYSTGYDRPGRFFAGVFSKSPSTVEATNAVMTEVERMKQEAPTPEELGLAKDSYLNSFVFNFDTEREILSRRMTYEYYDYPADFLQQTRDAIEEATTDDVLSVSKQYLNPDESHVLVVGNQEDFSQDLSSLTEGGSVNEIDISIPTSPPGDEDERAASDDAKAKGMEALRAVKAELGGDAYGDIEAMRVKGQQDASAGGKDITLDLTVTRQMPDKYRIVRGTPMGEVTIVINGDQGQLQSPRGTKQMPSSQMKQFKSRMWRDMTYLMTNLDAEGLTAVHQGTETVEGTDYTAVEVRPPAGDAYTLLLDPDTMRPRRMTYTAQTRQGPKESMDVYKDYKTMSGIAIPHTSVTYQDGSKASTITFSSVTINPDIEEDLFAIDGASE
jgi:predicted Zn-dependent peptidase/outer membrane lipoprotein-sorting protein